MWSIFAARTLKPAFSMRPRIWPAAPLTTASGLMIASVRSIVIVTGSARPAALGTCPVQDAWRLRSARRVSFHRSPASFPEDLRDGRAHVGRAPDQRGTRLLERGHLLGRGALSPRDDRARVAHAASGRRRLAADERDDGILDVAPDEGGRHLLGGPADLA